MTPDVISAEPSSYKDANGYVFYKNNNVFRKLSPEGKTNYLAVKETGIYEVLISGKLLYPFEEEISSGELILISSKINFISYPYEWCFQQMKTAALFHLDLNEICSKYKVMLKDATPFNIQFIDGKPIFIDILSFATQKSTDPWYAYKQFCETFLSPILIGKYTLLNGNKLLSQHLDGIPLAITSSLLPWRSKLNSLSLLHIHAHKRALKNKTGKAPSSSTKNTLSLIHHLQTGIEETVPKKHHSTWLQYKTTAPYSEEETRLKQKTIKNWILKKNYNQVLDIGANHLDLATIAATQSREVIVIDKEHSVVNQLFSQLSKKEFQNKNILPLHIDITEPTPSMGINLTERTGFLKRIHPDMTFALALIHHLFHEKNIPLLKMAELFSEFSRSLIIEFVSEKDEMFQKIKNRNNNHPYSQELFEQSFTLHFSITEKKEIKKDKRFLYLMEKINRE